MPGLVDIYTGLSAGTGLSQQTGLGGVNWLPAPGGVAPAIAWDFIGNRGALGGISVPISSILSFSRSSAATYNNSSGIVSASSANAPRYDYNPSTLSALGLMGEGARTNLWSFSDQLGNATAWTANNVTVASNVGVAPDGQSSSDRVVPVVANLTFKELRQDVALTNGVVYTGSIFAKYDGGYRYVQALANNPGFGTFAINYDLLSGVETAFSAGTSTVIGRGIIPYGNGWYRIWVAATAIATIAGRLVFDIIPASNSIRGVEWASNGTSGVQMWGAVIEPGSTASSYIPTTSGASDRTAELETASTAALSALGVISEGAFVIDLQADTRAIATATVGGFANSSSPSNNDSITIEAGGGTITGRMSSGGASVSVSSGVSLDATRRRIAVGFKANDLWISVNGGAAVRNTSVAFPATVQNLFCLLSSPYAVGSNSVFGTQRQAFVWNKFVPSSYGPALSAIS